MTTNPAYPPLNPPSLSRSTGIWPILCQFWPWIHGLCLLAVLIQPTDSAGLAGRYSKVSIILFAILAVTWPVVWLGVRRWIPALIDRTRKLIPLARLALLAVSAVALLGIWTISNTTESHSVIKLYVTFIILTVSIALLDGITTRRYLNRLGLVLVIGSGIFCTLLVPHFPSLLWTDEGYSSAIGISFAQTHHLFPTYFFGGVPYGAMFSMVYAGLGPWYRLFGVSIGVGRLFIWLIALLALFCIYNIGRLVYGKWAGVAAVILTMFPLFVGNVLRADISIELYLGIALWAFVYAEARQKKWPHLVVGLATGFSLDGHPNAYRFVIAFALAYLVEYMIETWKRKHLFIDQRMVLLVIGQLIGVAAYLALYLGLEPTGFLNIAQTNHGFLHLANAPSSLWHEIQSALFNAPLLLGCGLVGAAVALFRRNRLDRLLLIVCGGSLLIFATTNPTGIYRGYYLMQWCILLAVLAEGAIAQLGRLAQHETVYLGVTALLLVATLGWLFAEIKSQASQGYDQALLIADKVRDLVPLSNSVVAVDPFYMRMFDYPKFIEENADEIAGTYRHIDPAAIWEQLAPDDVVIVRGYPIPPSGALLSYVQHHLILAACWTTPQMGEVDLYMNTLPNGPLNSKTCQVFP